MIVYPEEGKKRSLELNFFCMDSGKLILCLVELKSQVSLQNDRGIVFTVFKRNNITPSQAFFLNSHE